jgi:glyoxylate carboligase
MKMQAVDPAVRILEAKGITCAFGVPGPAINPPPRRADQADGDQAETAELDFVDGRSARRRSC